MSTRVARGSDATPSKILGYNIGTIPKNMSTKFQLKRSKLNLDIVEKPENREHKLTDSNITFPPRCTLSINGWGRNIRPRPRQTNGPMLSSTTYSIVVESTPKQFGVWPWTRIPVRRTPMTLARPWQKACTFLRYRNAPSRACSLQFYSGHWGPA